MSPAPLTIASIRAHGVRQLTGYLTHSVPCAVDPANAVNLHDCSGDHGACDAAVGVR